MNKLISLLIVGLLTLGPVAIRDLYAQNITNPQVTRNQTDTVRAEFPPFTVNRAEQTINISSYGLSSHAVTYATGGVATGVTVTVTASTNGTSYASQGTSTAGAGTISFTGAFSFVRISFSGLTVSMPNFTAVYTGNTAIPASTLITADLDEIVTELETANTTLTSIETAVEDTTAIPVLSRGTDTGGTTGSAIVTTASTNGTIVNAAATGLYGITAISTSTTATVSYLRLYNAVAPPSACGATGFVRSYPIPSATAAGQVGGFVIPFTVPDTGSFTTGLSYCVTGGGTSSDNTAALAGIYINIEYYDAP